MSNAGAAPNHVGLVTRGAQLEHSLSRSRLAR